MDRIKRFIAELAKAICWVLMIIAGIGAIGAAYMVFFEGTHWVWLVVWAGVTAIFHVAGKVTFWLIYQVRDPARDFLAEEFGKYFERDGLAMMVAAGEWDQRTFAVCFYLQNQYDTPCEVNVAARAEGVMSADLFEAEAWEAVDVPAGAYLVVRAPMGVPAKYQGRRVWFRIGADVRYPDQGRRRVRARVGKDLDTADLSGRSGTLTASEAVISRVKLTLPTGVRVFVDDTELPRIETIDQRDGETATLSNLGISG